ncbi:MAG TPA: SRPBCC family protein [Bauldia sp.]|nr:SRPBCC family protein [Bauldia sp.]
MPHFATERHVAHSAADMFALVADVETYPQFVPMCEKLTVRARSREGEREVLVADMTVAYAIVRETFTTKVTVDRQALAISAEYINGPFHHLDSRWTFVPEGERACLVRFAIDYEFKSRVLSAVMGATFESAFRKFGEAFEKRADTVYGTAG